MKVFYHQGYTLPETLNEDLTALDLSYSIEKTRLALEIAYAGFDNAVETDLIDSYIYEIIALQKRYNYFVDLASAEPSKEPKSLYQHSPIRSLVSHVLG